jgi:hypothetical protein
MRDNWHLCHFCGTEVRNGKEHDGTRHWLSDCRPDLTRHEPGELCTWGSEGCYAEHDKGKDYVYHDGPM